MRSTTQIWVLTRHQYGISAFVSQTSFGTESRGGIAKCRLFSQARILRLKKKKKKSLERTSLRLLRTILPIKVFVPWLFYLLMDKQGPILFEELQSISLLPISFLQVFGATGQPGAFVLRAVEVVEGEAEHELVKEELLARAQRAKLKSVNCRIVRVSDISKTLTSVARNAFAFLELPVEV